SGVSNCSGAVPSGNAINTSTAGSQTFTVTAIDAIGNTSTSSRTYSVAYDACLLFDVTKAYKAGSTIPIKLELCDASGSNVSSGSIQVVATGVYMVSNNTAGPLADSGNANPDNQFR